MAHIQGPMRTGRRDRFTTARPLGVIWVGAQSTSLNHALFAMIDDGTSWPPPVPGPVLETFLSFARRREHVM